jgi:hypothetical protein
MSRDSQLGPHLKSLENSRPVSGAYDDRLSGLTAVLNSVRTGEDDTQLVVELGEELDGVRTGMLQAVDDKSMQPLTLEEMGVMLGDKGENDIPLQYRTPRDRPPLPLDKLSVTAIFCLWTSLSETCPYLILT